jgi:CRISPR system Cascade subunit CasB
MTTELQKIGDAYAVILPEEFLSALGITNEVNLRLENQRIIIDPVRSKRRGFDEHEFVEHVLKFRQDDNKAAMVALKCADNPAKALKSWEYLARFINNGYDPQLSFTIAAAIIKSEIKTDGEIGIGTALALRYKDDGGKDSNQAKAKLRRLLACDSAKELCDVLRPLLSLINSKGSLSLDYEKLLKQLRKFNANSQFIKTQWATDFYRHQPTDEANV